MKKGFSLLELIFSIVVIGITISVVPYIVEVSKKNNEIIYKQEYLEVLKRLYVEISTMPYSNYNFCKKNSIEELEYLCYYTNAEPINKDDKRHIVGKPVSEIIYPTTLVEENKLIDLSNNIQRVASSDGTKVVHSFFYDYGKPKNTNEFEIANVKLSDSNILYVDEMNNPNYKVSLAPQTSKRFYKENESAPLEDLNYLQLSIENTENEKYSFDVFFTNKGRLESLYKNNLVYKFGADTIDNCKLLCNFQGNCDASECMAAKP